MQLKNALELQKKSKGKIDILELAGIKIKYNFCDERYYKNKIEKLPKGDYFISDLDGTFYRGVLIKEAFSLFAKYLTQLDLRSIDLDKYKLFLDDYKFFRDLEKDAYNKKIAYDEYLNAGMFILYKYNKLVSWHKYISYLKEEFYINEKVNPLRFSMKKIKEILLSGKNFIFVSGSSNFVFDIYLELLKDHIRKDLGKGYVKNIYGVSSYVNFSKKYVYNMWQAEGKYKIIEQLKSKGIVKNIIGGMGDTSSDYGISKHLDKGADFYFINPAFNVISEHNKVEKGIGNYNFISERKDLIFQYNINEIKLF